MGQTKIAVKRCGMCRFWCWMAKIGFCLKYEWSTSKNCLACPSYRCEG